EAVVGRQEAGVVAEVPLAGHPGRVAFLLDQLGERHLRIGDAMRYARAERAVDAETVRVATGQQRCSGGGANRLGNVEVGESTAFSRQAIEVGSSPLLCTVAAEVAIAEIVRE